MEKKLQKIYLTFYSLLIEQDLTSSLLNLVNNLSEGLHRIKCKLEHDYRKCELCGLNISIATVFSNIQSLKITEYQYIQIFYQ